MAEQLNSPQIPQSAFEFRDTPTVVRCSNLTCSNGHTWTPEIQVTPCPGCKSPILAIRMVNCPQCNEPSASLSLRTDHLGRAQAITPRCLGAASLADIHQIDLKFTHARDEQAMHVVREMPAKI